MSEKENQPVRRLVDLFPTFAALRARHSELLEIDPETGEEEWYLAGVQDFFDRVRATGAILSADEERRASQSILNYWTTVLYRADRKPSNTTLVELNPELKPKLYDERCPYPGVREFDETEGKYFFGRQRTIDYLIARLKEENFLTLVGPSGSGKSSLVRAGLLPAIKNIGLTAEEDPAAVQRYFFPIITPGSKPLVNLASMLSRALDHPNVTVEDHHESLRQDSKHLLKFLTEKIARPAVIVVDQFEELFTLCMDVEPRRMFINNLLALDNSKHRVILCSSLEGFDGGLKRLPEFEKVFERGRALLPRLGASELSEAITKPADLVGFKLKDQTVKDIVQEIGTLPVALPLLQFTLFKLWEKRGRHDEFFAKSGGCRPILTQSAEEFLISLESAERELAERMFRRMVKFEYTYQARIMPVQLGTRAVPKRFQDLAADLGPPEQVRAMVERLGKAQLVRRSISSIPEDEQLELVHESLIQNWPRLSQWVAYQKRRRFKFASLAVAALLIMAAVILVFTGVLLLDLQSKWAAKQRDQESTLRAQDWALESRRHLNGKRLDEAMLFSLAAYLTDPSDDNLEARSVLISALIFRPRPKAFLAQPGLGDVAFSPDGRLLAANDGEGKITFWNLSAPGPLVDGKTVHDSLSQGDEIAPIVFSNDGKWLASGGQGAVTLWDVVTRQQIRKLSAPDAGRIRAITLSRDSQRLAGLGDGVVVIWDTVSGDIVPLAIKAPEKVRTLAFSNSGEILATGDDEGNVELVAVNGGSTLRTLQTCACLRDLARTRNIISSMAFSPDDQVIAVSGTEETNLWSASSGEQIARLSLSQVGVGMILSFSEDGATLAGFEGDKQIYLWDMKTFRPIGPDLFRPIASAASLAFSRDAKTLATRGKRGIVLWDLSERILAGHTTDITDLVFSPDGRLLASSDNNGAVNLWNAASGEPIGRLPNEDRSAALSIAFSHNGKLLAAGLINGKILLRTVEDQSTFLLEGGDRPQEEIGALLNQSAVAFSDDDQTLISVGVRDEYLQIERWNAPGRNRQGGTDSIVLGEGTAVTAIALSPNGKYLAVATDKKELKLWNIGENRTTPTLVVENGLEIIRSLKFSPSGRWLFFGGEDKSTVYGYDVSATKSPKTIFTVDFSGVISDLALSLDEKTLAVAVNPVQRDELPLGGTEATALIFVDVATGRVIADVLRGQRSPISALAFSQTGMLATGSEDLTVLLWDLNLCEAKARICDVVPLEFAEQYGTGEIHRIACQPNVERKECQGKAN